MFNTLFTELTPSEEANLSGGHREGGHRAESGNSNASNRSLVQQQTNATVQVSAFGSSTNGTTQDQRANGNSVGNN